MECVPSVAKCISILKKWIFPICASNQKQLDFKLGKLLDIQRSLFNKILRKLVPLAYDLHDSNLEKESKVIKRAFINDVTYRGWLSYVTRATNSESR